MRVLLLMPQTNELNLLCSLAIGETEWLSETGLPRRDMNNLIVIGFYNWILF